MVIGGIEVADQHSAEGIVQNLVQNLLVPAPPQEESLAGRVEGPDAAVDPVLAPSGLAGLATGLPRMRSRIWATADWTFWATWWTAWTMAPRLSCNRCTVSRYHWMVRKGSRPSSRRAAIRLSRLTPTAVSPKPHRPVGLGAPSSVGSRGKSGQ